MRVSPIGVVGGLLNQSFEYIADAARHDANLSHPNIICQEANAAYVVAIAYLIKCHKITRTTRGDAIEVALHYCRSKEVCSWVTCIDPINTVSKEMTRENIGWVKWGIILAFHHLISCTIYEDAIRETCRMGGDTDTNACIVGGLVGATIKMTDIPSTWLNKVLNCRERPKWLRPSCVSGLLNKIHPIL